MAAAVRTGQLVSPALISTNDAVTRVEHMDAATQKSKTLHRSVHGDEQVSLLPFRRCGFTALHYDSARSHIHLQQCSGNVIGATADSSDALVAGLIT